MSKMDLSSLLSKCKSKSSNARTLRCLNFRSSGKFVTGSNNGTVSLFNGTNLMKAKKLGDLEVLLSYCNGQIVAAVENGNLTIMNENLGIVKEFPVRKSPFQSLCGNASYLASGDENGSVCYYKTNNEEANVVFLDFQSYIVI